MHRERVFYLWGRYLNLAVHELQAYSRLAARVVERPAVRKAIADEGLPLG